MAKCCSVEGRLWDRLVLEYICGVRDENKKCIGGVCKRDGCVSVEDAS